MSGIPKDIEVRKDLDSIFLFCINQSSNPLMLSTKIFTNLTHDLNICSYFSYFFCLNFHSDKIKIALSQIFREFSYLTEKESDANQNIGSSTIKNSASFITHVCEHSQLGIFASIQKLFKKIDRCDVIFFLFFDFFPPQVYLRVF